MKTRRSMKRTRWFPALTNPVHKGVYEIRILWADGTADFEKLEWDGRKWLGWPMFHDDKWRGLVEQPK